MPSSALDSDILLLREARIARMKVRVIKTAVNMESNTPMARVTAKPFTTLAPKVLPNQKSTPQLMSVDRLPSRMAGQARLKGRATDRLDRESAEFHQRVYEGYQSLAGSGKHRFKVIDASGTPQQVLAEALAHLKRLEHGLLKYL